MLVGTRWATFAAKRGRRREYQTKEERAAFLRKESREFYRRKAKAAGTTSDAHIVMTHQPPPPEVLAERDAAMWRPTTLTALVFGDPLPGRSALDRR